MQITKRTITTDAVSIDMDDSDSDSSDEEFVVNDEYKYCRLYFYTASWCCIWCIFATVIILGALMATSMTTPIESLPNITSYVLNLIFFA